MRPSRLKLPAMFLLLLISCSLISCVMSTVSMLSARSVLTAGAVIVVFSDEEEDSAGGLEPVALPLPISVVINIARRSDPCLILSPAFCASFFHRSLFNSLTAFLL